MQNSPFRDKRPTIALFPFYDLGAGLPLVPAELGGPGKKGTTASSPPPTGARVPLVPALLLGPGKNGTGGIAGEPLVPALLGGPGKKGDCRFSRVLGSTGAANAPAARVVRKMSEAFMMTRILLIVG